MRNVRSDFARLLIDVKLRRRLPARAHGARERDISFPLGRKNKAGRVGGGEGEGGGGVDCGSLANDTLRPVVGGSWVCDFNQ